MILFAASSTGGHLYPAIALAQEMGEPCHFLVSKDQMAPRLFKQYNFPVTLVGISSKRPWQWVYVWLKTIQLIRRLKIRMVIATGGIVTIPVVFAAKLLGIPVVLHEQNVIPGRANRLLQHRANAVITSFPEAAVHFGRSVHCLGVPLRQVFLDDALSAMFAPDPSDQRPLLLVFGGSQGAWAINKWVADHYDRFQSDSFRLVHVTGESYFKSTYGDQSHVVLTNASDVPSVWVFPYFERMDILIEKADLVVCRAGASSLFECAETDTRGVYIPYPYAKDNHQYWNAKAAVTYGLGTLMSQDGLDFEKVMAILADGHQADVSKGFPRGARSAIAMFIRDAYGVVNRLDDSLD
ncbi:UDP-N-acetylglucosamine--N-acetylmuramyl-(pentapeptide) pyrophosphoryl-undecaprenol N-acetylglucosamine transferase [bacterium]|jgi:UDP-N-acetylglucosamine--N-acetylmuramyl-(pentapeptide) pyrophosphoryl-undecaprenol N-acetylglucosamine transferase|nr:UDP-N-acetylglucosamine--N-acetylmuramyl-(pentapeptide) pyrophosphoryl-undecaprenol N-acetylglucosamine transferase [bacterium]